MSELPTHSALRDVPRERILALLHEHGDAAAAASYDFEWQRTRELRRAVEHALACATGPDAAAAATSAPDLAPPHGHHRAAPAVELGQWLG